MKTDLLPQCGHSPVIDKREFWKSRTVTFIGIGFIPSVPLPRREALALPSAYISWALIEGSEEFLVLLQIGAGFDHSDYLIQRTPLNFAL
jgi:hypothetical protein